jgi:hypothetical protein
VAQKCTEAHLHVSASSIIFPGVISRIPLNWRRGEMRCEVGERGEREGKGEGGREVACLTTFLFVVPPLNGNRTVPVKR